MELTEQTFLQHGAGNIPNTVIMPNEAIHFCNTCDEAEIWLRYGLTFHRISGGTGFYSFDRVEVCSNCKGKGTVYGECIHRTYRE